MTDKDWGVFIYKGDALVKYQAHETKTAAAIPDDVIEDDAQETTKIGLIEKYMRDNPGIHTPNEVSLALNIPPKHVASALYKLWKRKRVFRHETGEYEHRDSIANYRDEGGECNA